MTSTRGLRMSDVSAKVGEVLFAPPSRSALRSVYDIMRPGAVGYVALRGQVDSLVLHQALLDKVVRGEDSLFYSCYYATKGLFYRIVFSERQLSAEKLFDVQLENISALNFNLCGITSESRRELDYLREYFDDRHSELRSCVGLVKRTGYELEAKAGEYGGLQKILSSFRERDDGFFDCELKARRLKREISDKMHNYTLSNESVIDLGKEVEFLGVVEDLLLSSIQLSEHIALKARRFERHIEATRRAYLLVKSQQAAVRALDDAVTTMVDFTLGMHNLLADGLRDMAGIMEPVSSVNSFYPAAVKSLGGLVSSVSEANLMRNIEVEDAVRRYTSNSKV